MDIGSLRVSILVTQTNPSSRQAQQSCMRKEQDVGSYLPTQQNNSMIKVFGDVSTDFLIKISSICSKDLETQILASVNNQNLH